MSAMENMTLRNITKACNGAYYGAPELFDNVIEGAVIDSRQVQENFLYIPMRGERVDGHRFIPDVFEKGALAVLSEEVLENAAGPYILVESCPVALKEIAAFYRETLSIPIVGIAGSVGKTSTKEMIAAVLAQKFSVLKTEGNFNNEIGLPLTLLRIRAEHQVAVVEMGISDFGEMHRLAQMAKPDVCVMTNIGQCHLENLIDRDGVLRAKSEIFDFLKSDGVIVLNGNDDKLSTIEEVRGVRPMRYFVADESAEPMCCFAADESAESTSCFVTDESTKPMQESYFVVADSIANHGLCGMEACLHFSNGESFLIKEPIPGMHNIYNACAAACVGHGLGLSYQEICDGIASAKTIAGRTNLIEAKGMVIIDDCYNANPVSMKASLDVLALAQGRKIAVLGDMGELGEKEKELHAQVGAYAATKGIDVLFCTGPLSKELARTAASGCEVKYFATREELTTKLCSYTKKGDTVLVKASHFMQFSKIVDALR